ncbi:MAG TPA: EF-P lysine aminoacylase EpmA [Desulfosalsimonadaceae bacterium]|nr:EF-P lysine aminoacylase EpmA [Desulfosalsimonadaceae bacterium]
MMFSRQQRLHQTLPVRSRILAGIRRFFIENQYIEVETPICIPAPLPEPHIYPPSAAGGYLQPSPEACMKPLLAAGFEKIFQICKCFRKNERGGRHLPEFSMLEWYAAGHTYTDLMHTCEAMFEKIGQTLGLPIEIEYQENLIDLTRPWRLMTVSEAFDRYGTADMETAIREESFDEIMGLEIEPNLGLQQPVFLYDYPAETSPLAAPKPENPMLAQRFELYIAGLEICNGFTELTDPEFQQTRFENELARRRAAGLPTYPFPDRFLKALRSLPDAAGCALGTDRLMMLFTDAKSIDEVVAFTPETI